MQTSVCLRVGPGESKLALAPESEYRERGSISAERHVGRSGTATFSIAILCRCCTLGSTRS
jgi:hypothetical protein